MRKKLSLVPIFFTAFIDYIGLAMVIPIFSPSFLRVHSPFFSIDTPPETRTLLLGLLLSLFPLAQFFGSPIFGGFSDRFGRKPLLILTLSGTVVSYCLLGLAYQWKSFGLLLVGRILCGFMAGNISVVQSAIADLSRPEEKARNFSYIALAFSGGLVIGPYIGASLSNHNAIAWFTDAIPFWFTALLSLVNMALVITYFKETLVHKRPSEVSFLTGIRRIHKALKQKGLRLLWLMLLCYGLAWAFLAQFFQVFLIQKFHFSKEHIGHFYSYWAFFSIFTQFAIARPLFPHFKQKHLIGVSLLCLTITVLTLIIPDKSIYLFLIIPFVALFQQIAYPNVIALVSNAAGPHSQGEMLGISASIQAASQVLPATISGSIVVYHPTFPTVIGACFVLCTWLFFQLFIRKQHHKLNSDS